MNWIEIFKTGTHTDSSGKSHNITNADLNKIVDTYDPKKHEAPVVIGHPKDNAPAYAWVEKLKVAGEKLLCLEKDAQPEFNDMRNRKMFKKRSVSLYPDGTLRHVGWLGATPPAIKGLQDTSFGEEADCIIYEFSEQEEPKVNELEKLKADLAAANERANTAENVAKDYKEKSDSKTLEFAEAEKSRKREEIKNFVEQGTKDGTILPAWKEMGLISFMESLDGCSKDDAVLEFAEGDKSDKVDQLEWMQKFMSNFSAHPLFKEMVKPADESKSNEFAEEDAIGKEMAAMVNPS